MVAFNSLPPRPSLPPDSGQERSELAAQRQLVQALLDPRHYPPGTRRVQLIETHISWVLVAGRFAYKIKKAVNLGFLDFTTLAKRRFYCAEELRLNRRLAPQLYLEVVPIGGSPENPALGQQPAIEYAVKMHRFVPTNLLDKLAARNLITPQHIDQLAADLAAFHRRLPPAVRPGGDDSSPYGTPATIRAAAMQNFEQLQPLLPDAADQAQLATIRRLTEAEFAAREQDFAARRAQGFVRECHGDLHLGNIALIRGQPVPFDGIEFSPELRWDDVMSETAFPVMDLLQHRQPRLAHRLLNAWLEASGDYAGMATFTFYLAYRAMVRAKITAIRAAQPGLTRLKQSKNLAACRRYLLLAEQTLRDPQPALIITHGLPGSGKSTFAQIALEKYGAIRIRSDVERKRLFGLAPLEDSRTGENIYSAEATQRTYARLLELARIVLAAGYPVIVDAAFLKQSERRQFRQLANEMRAPYAIASLHAPDATLQARVAKRHAGAYDASEADVAVLKMLQAVQEPLTGEEQTFSAEFLDGAKDAEARGWERLENLMVASISPPLGSQGGLGEAKT